MKQDDHNVLPDDKEILCLLQGAWWMDENDSNALFSIKGDSLYYADMPDRAPIKIEISKGILTWKTEVPINWEIIDISPKKLKYYDHFNSCENTMYKF